MGHKMVHSLSPCLANSHMHLSFFLYDSQLYFHDSGHNNWLSDFSLMIACCGTVYCLYFFSPLHSKAPLGPSKHIFSGQECRACLTWIRRPWEYSRLNQCIIVPPMMPLVDSLSLRAPTSFSFQMAGKAFTAL